MHRAADSIDADPSDVRQFERTVDDTDDPRIIIEAEHRYEMTINDQWAYHRWEDPTPRWLESVVSDFGVRGIRTARGGQ